MEPTDLIPEMEVPLPRDWRALHFGIPADRLPEDLAVGGGFYDLQRLLGIELARTKRKSGITVFGMVNVISRGVIYSLWPVFDTGRGGDSFCQAVQKVLPVTAISYEVEIGASAIPWLRCEDREHVYLGMVDPVPDLAAQRQDPRGRPRFRGLDGPVVIHEDVRVGRRLVRMEKRLLVPAKPSHQA